MRTLIASLFTIGFLTVFSITIVKSINLKQNCTGYLGRASNANTVETAEKELSKAIKYLEVNNLTKGYTSVLWQTPDEDIEFWYNNLKESQQELLKVTDKTSSLEKSNILLKLRETLIDNEGKQGDSITVPGGLSRYPNNGFFGTLLLFFLLATIVSWVILLIELD